MKLASCLVALSLATVSLANPPAADGDYTTLPPDPVELETTLSGLAVDMTAAADAAVKAGGGQLSAIRLVKQDGKWTYEVLLLDGGSMKRALVDATSGDVKVAKLGAGDAVKAAQAKVAGRVGMITSDLMGDPPIWRVTVFAKGKAHVVTVNAMDGSVISDEVQQRFPGEATDGKLEGEPGGLQWITVKEGTGASPKAPDSMVKVNYSGGWHAVRFEPEARQADRVPPEPRHQGMDAGRAGHEGWREAQAGDPVHAGLWRAGSSAHHSAEGHADFRRGVDRRRHGAACTARQHAAGGTADDQA